MTPRESNAFAAALLGLAPLVFVAADLRAGLVLGSGVAVAFAVLAATRWFDRGTSAFATALWCTVAAAVSIWLAAAWAAAPAGFDAVLPLAAANAVWWQRGATGQLPLPPGAALIAAPVAAGALRGAAALAPPGFPDAFVDLLAWLVSPGGLLIAAALAVALFRTLHRAASPPQDPPLA